MICAMCGSHETITAGQRIGTYKGHWIYEKWEECATCGSTDFKDDKPEWECSECGASGSMNELVYVEEEDDCKCPHCGSFKLWEV